MKMRPARFALFACATSLLFVACAAEKTDHRPPNVVIIFADDLGYADVGIYGAKGFETPNLDQMAADGIRFTQFYMPASGCSPSRAALLTGSYPLRAGIPDVLFPWAKIGLNSDEVTIAELLKSRGYATRAIGKWHLGDHPNFLPTSHGFDSYFGLPYSNDMSPEPKNNPRERASEYPPLPLIQDTTIIELEPDQRFLTRRYTERALEFIQENQQKPFFLYLAHSMPHAPLWASAPFVGSSEQGMYGDVLQELDWSTGQILQILHDLQLEENTLVMFTSDNGPWLIFGNHAGSAGPLREGKASSFEGGHRVPAIFRWPGTIPAGTVSDEVATAMDLLPTIAAIAGAQTPRDRVLDGFDISPILAGKPEAKSQYESFFYYRAGHLQAVRSGKWKLHVPHNYLSSERGQIANDGMPGSYAREDIGLELFDLENDISERINIAAEHPEVVERLLKMIQNARIDIGDRATEVVGKNARPPGRVSHAWSAQPAK